MAHRRLSIVDLSARSMQPMLDASNRLCVVFNGEIYNFRELRAELAQLGHTFRTDGDTEVVLAAYLQWGSDCLGKLNGMFAFALYDSAREQLLLARDRAGEKPLFYHAADSQIRFASELKALLADERLPRKIDRCALDSFLAEGYVASPDCILEGYNKLPPAHALAFDTRTGRSTVWRYWSIPPFDSRALDIAPELLTEELEGLLEGAVWRQLVADVPVGVLLSGGVDSSLITALAARATGTLKTFTVRFPKHARYDESTHARLIADHFGTEHQELDAGEVTVDLLPLLARQFDEPLVDSSMVPTYLVSRLVRQHCTVALGGDGGDELFGGYSHYDRLLRFQQRLHAIPRSVRALLAAGARKVMPVGTKGRNWLAAVAADYATDVPLVASYFDFPARAELLRTSVALGGAEKSWAQRSSRGIDLVDRATRTDFLNYLPEDILVKVDRASMLTSLEVRAPMLDVAVIEFAFSKVPPSLKVTTSGRKLLLKRLASRLLPPAFDRTRKQGFSIPLGEWLRGGVWQDFFRDTLLDPGQTHFDRAVIADLLAGQKQGRANGERLFGLVMFELWRREYGIQLE